MRISKRLLDFTLATSFVTIVLEITSLVVPGWLVLEVTASGDDVTHRKEIYAVWFIIICGYNATHSSPCVTQSYVDLQGVLERRRSQSDFLETDPDIGDHKPRIAFSTIQQWEIETTLGFVCAIVCTGVLIRVRMRSNHVLATPSRDTRPSTIAIVVAAAAAGASCFAYILSVQRIAKIHTSLHTISSLTKTKPGVPYGLIIASLGTLAAFVTTICAGAVVGCRKRSPGSDADSTRDENQAMPMLQVQNSSGQQQGYVSPLPPQYVGYNMPQDEEVETSKIGCGEI